MSESWLFSVVDVIAALTSSDNPRDYWFKMKIRVKSEAGLIFTVLAELSTRQIAETMEAKGLTENSVASKQGGGIAKKAKQALEHKTGKKVINAGNYLTTTKTLKDKS